MGVKPMCDIPDNILEKLQNDVSEIKTALLGNEYNPRGAIYTINEHEKCIERLEKRFDKMVWTATGAGGAAGFIIGLLLKFIPQIV